jgi:hypothetical protein
MSSQVSLLSVSTFGGNYGNSQFVVHLDTSARSCEPISVRNNVSCVMCIRANLTSFCRNVIFRLYKSETKRCSSAKRKIGS